MRDCVLPFHYPPPSQGDRVTPGSCGSHHLGSRGLMALFSPCQGDRVTPPGSNSHSRELWELPAREQGIMALFSLCQGAGVTPPGSNSHLRELWEPPAREQGTNGSIFTLPAHSASTGRHFCIFSSQQKMLYCCKIIKYMCCSYIIEIKC